MFLSKKHNLSQLNKYLLKAYYVRGTKILSPCPRKALPPWKGIVNTTFPPPTGIHSDLISWDKNTIHGRWTWQGRLKQPKRLERMMKSGQDGCDRNLQKKELAGAGYWLERKGPEKGIMMTKKSESRKTWVSIPRWWHYFKPCFHSPDRQMLRSISSAILLFLGMGVTHSILPICPQFFKLVVISCNSHLQGGEEDR